MADDNAQDTGGEVQDQQDDKQQSGGQQDQGREDTARQQIEENVKQDAEDKGKTLTQTEVDKIVADRIARERKKFADYDDLKKAAAKLKQIEDANKSEHEKLNDQLTAAQVELQRYRVAEIRRAAASTAGLDPELAEFITAADEEEAKAQAEKLAERFKATAASSSRQSADFKQGARTSPAPTRSRDDLLRNLAGYGR